MHVSKGVSHVSNLVLTYIACDYEMHLMLVLMLWNVNAWLTPEVLHPLPPVLWAASLVYVAPS
jgi:hypothetical protein